MPLLGSVLVAIAEPSSASPYECPKLQGRARRMEMDTQTGTVFLALSWSPGSGDLDHVLPHLYSGFRSFGSRNAGRRMREEGWGKRGAGRGMREQGSAAMSCFFHMVAPNGKQRAPDTCPRSPKLPALSWQLRSQGEGPLSRSRVPAPSQWRGSHLRTQDLPRWHFQPFSYSTYKRKTQRSCLQAASLSIAGTSWWSWCATLSWASSLRWSSCPW